jgi:anti-sigma factor RsiW
MDHISEAELDRYALGQLSQFEIAPLEEHLLICANCQGRLRLTDQFIAALRAATDEGGLSYEH